MNGLAPSITTCSEGTCWHSSGRAHAERRVAQARAAAKPRVKKKFSKATRNDWKKEEQ